MTTKAAALLAVAAVILAIPIHAGEMTAAEKEARIQKLKNEIAQQEKLRSTNRATQEKILSDMLEATAKSAIHGQDWKKKEEINRLERELGRTPSYQESKSKQSTPPRQYTAKDLNFKNIVPAPEDLPKRDFQPTSTTTFNSQDISDTLVTAGILSGALSLCAAFISLCISIWVLIIFPIWVIRLLRRNNRLLQLIQQQQPPHTSEKKPWDQ